MNYINGDYDWMNNYYYYLSSSSTSSYDQNQMSYYYDNYDYGAAAAAASSSENETSSDISKIDMESAIRGERKLDLKLTKTPSLMKLLSNFSQTDDGVNGEGTQEKRKALNFPILCVQIGSWMREARHEGELVAKCYFKKKQLVWETLNGNLKNKIEFQWSNVSAINASYHSNTGVLDIMLDQPPLFFHEVNPQPRKHTNWEQCEDFTTNRQASLVRKHRIIVAPEILEKHYKQIIGGDPKLYNLSQRSFPYESSMCFPEIHFSNELHINASPVVLPSHIPLYPHSATEITNNNGVSNSSNYYVGDYPTQLTSNQTLLGLPHQQVDYTYSDFNVPMINGVGLQQPLSYASQPLDITAQMAALRTDLPYTEDSFHQSNFSYDYLLANDHQLSHNFQYHQHYSM